MTNEGLQGGAVFLAVSKRSAISQFSVNYGGSQLTFTSHLLLRFCIVSTVSLSLAEPCQVSPAYFFRNVRVISISFETV